MRARRIIYAFVLVFCCIVVAGVLLTCFSSKQQEFRNEVNQADRLRAKMWDAVYPVNEKGKSYGEWSSGLKYQPTTPAEVYLSMPEMVEVRTIGNSIGYIARDVAYPYFLFAYLGDEGNISEPFPFCNLVICYDVNGDRSVGIARLYADLIGTC